MGIAETAELAVKISLNDQLSRGITGIQGKLNKLNTGLGRTGKGAAQMGAGFAKAGALAAGFAVTGIAAATKAAIDWEDAFAGVVKTVDEADLAAAGKTFRDLELSLRKMSTEMPIAATELAAIAESAGAMGIAGKDIEEFTRVVALISTTTDVAAADAATALGQLSNVLGLTVEDYDNFASALVDLGNSGESTESQILEIASRAGAAAKLIGVGAAETLGWSSAVANLGIEVEAGGSSIQRFFLESAKSVAAGGKELKIMAKTAGVSAKAFRKAFNKDASGALTDFLDGLGELDQAAQLSVLEDLGFNDVRVARALLGLAGDTDNLTDSLETGTEAWKANVAAQVEFDKRNKTVRSAVTRLKNTVIDAAVTLGEEVAPAIGRAADEIATLLKAPGGANQLKEIGKEIGAAIDGINWQDVLNGARDFVTVLRGAMSVAKAMFDVFNALPGEIKAATVGFLALNKLSGGLIGGGLGNVVGGIGETIARSAGSKLPGVGKLFAQPVFVTNFPPGFGGAGGAGAGGKGGKGGIGKIGTGLAVLGAATTVIGAVETQQQVSAQSTEIAREVRATGERFVSENKLSTGQLEKAIGAVDAGIAQIRSNPLYTLVQGEALTELQQTKANLQRQLEQQRGGLEAQRTGERAITSSVSNLSGATDRHAERVSSKLEAGIVAQRAGERSISGKLVDVGLTTQRAGERSVAATDAVRSGQAIAAGVQRVANVQQAVAAAIAYAQQVRTQTSIDTTRGAVNRTTLHVDTSASRIVAAIWAARPIISATTVNRTTVVQQRYGRQSGSRNAGRTAQ